MKTVLMITLFGLVAWLPAPAQQKLAVVNAETPEGQLLQEAAQAEDPAKKTELYEQFLTKHADHDAALWVRSQLQDLYLKASAFDKALAAGEAILAKDPKDLAAAHLTLKAGEGKKDPALVLKWAQESCKLARAIATGPQPEDVEDEEWKPRVDFAKQVDNYAEYALFAQIVQTADPNQRLALIDGLRQVKPDGQYAPKTSEFEFNAHRQLNNNAGALATAERVVATDQSSEDMLIFLADQYMQQKKEPDKVVAYAQKVVELMKTKPKPEGMDDAAWANKKMSLSGLAHFLIGTTFFNQKKLKPADEALRAALPSVDANDQLKAAVLFYLGLANYQLGNRKAALSYNEQCAKIKSPFQPTATKNVALIRAGK